MSDPAEPKPANSATPEAAAAATLAAAREDRGGDARRQLRSQHPELDWSDPEGTVETLAILNDPQATADLQEAENDIATGDLVPLDRYAPPR